MRELQFSAMVNQFQPGIFTALNDKKEEMIQAGKRVFNLSVGTPDFAPAPHVMEALTEACKDPENYKYALADLPELLEAVQYRYAHRFGVEIQTDEIMSVYGSQEGMAHIGMALCDPGDTILVPNPGYPLFEMSGIMAGANVEYYEIREENGYLPDLKNIPGEVLERTKYMVVSYPLNPVCVCAPDHFYEELIAFAKEHHIVIIHDNAYSDIIFTREQGRSFLSFDGAKEVGVEFYSLSKSYNLTGARISFVVGNKAIERSLKRCVLRLIMASFCRFRRLRSRRLRGRTISSKSRGRSMQKETVRCAAVCEGSGGMYRTVRGQCLCGQRFRKAMRRPLISVCSLWKRPDFW